MAGDNPLHQFEIQPLIELSLFGYDISFTNSALWMVIACVGVTTLFGLMVPHRGMVPGRIQALAEILFNFIADTLEQSAGKEARRYFPFIFTIFSFILFGNVCGMLPYSFTFTSHIIVTFALAITVFSFVTLIAIMRHGTKFFGYFVPEGVPFFIMPLIVPIEIISYLSRPLSLSIRLFANMMAGHTMMKVFAIFSVKLAAISVIFGVAPLAINVALTALEFLVAFLQAYVFTILTCIYLHDAIHLH